MSRVSAERIFRSHFPSATIETQKRNGVTGLSVGRYYIVRPHASGAHNGSGDTKAQAWAMACAANGIATMKAGAP